jgi:TetR/AcrR family transcriptional regulator of autoinduction and epiphytic fitness
MVWVMRRAQAFLETLPDSVAPMDNLRAVVAWTMGLKLAGEMPSLPSQNSTLRATLIGNNAYMDGLMEVSDRLGAWIEAAQAQGALNPKLPAIAVLYTLFARACDPVLEFLKMGGQHSDEEIIALVLSTCFDGLSARQA